jgi:hypothetical protein
MCWGSARGLYAPVLVGLLLFGACSGAGESEVQGKAFLPPATTAVPIAAPTTTTLLAATAAPGPIVPVAAPSAPAVQPSISPDPKATAPRKVVGSQTRALPPRHVTEVADNGGFFTHSEDPADRTQGSATRVEADQHDPLRFFASGTPRNDGIVSFQASLVNESKQTISFGDQGLLVLFRLERQGEPQPRFVELRQPGVRELRPGESVEASLQTPYDYGHYQYSATTEVDYR